MRIPSAAQINGFYLPFVDWLAEHASAAEGLLVLGLNGAPGSGKSTLAALLCMLLSGTQGLRAVTLSLDELCLGRRGRQRRAEAVHSLLATRGVPGTHDTGLGLQILDALRDGASVSLPSFDVSRDERFPVARWPRAPERCDIVIFEGWCMGARPQPAHMLQDPVNALERLEDPEGAWRWYVNRELGGPYQRLFAQLDLLVMLRPPDFEQVYRWREAQEARLRRGQQEALAIMSPQELRRFVMHFERLTRFSWTEMPARADAVIDLDGEHQPVGVALGDLEVGPLC
jgi:D-glycerate 3-kinase